VSWVITSSYSNALQNLLQALIKLTVSVDLDIFSELQGLVGESVVAEVVGFLHIKALLLLKL
jgi:hypothetical protein